MNTKVLAQKAIELALNRADSEILFEKEAVKFARDNGITNYEAHYILKQAVVAVGIIKAVTYRHNASKFKVGQKVRFSLYPQTDFRIEKVNEDGTYLISDGTQETMWISNTQIASKAFKVTTTENYLKAL